MSQQHSITYIGTNDYDLDLFEGQYTVPDGISYNSYLITDQKIAIMDTVDKRKVPEYLELLHQALDRRTPDYLIISHMEPDHASGISHIIEAYPDICLVGNSKTFQLLSLYLEQVPKNILTVKERDCLSLGTYRLTFFMAPMVHWPEVMISYEETTQTLFSADAFGKFGVLTADVLTKEAWLCEARRYYFNIVGKYGAPVQALLKKLALLNIQIIAPLHGPALHAPLDFFLEKYDLWSRYLPETEGVFIAYTSFHGNTARAAHLLKKFLEEKGCSAVAIADLSREDMSEAIENAFRYSKIVLAAPSYDGGLMPFMEDFLHHLRAKNFQNRQVSFITNGSWAPCADKVMTGILSSMKEITIAEPTITLCGTVKPADITKLKSLADTLIMERN